MAQKDNYPYEFYSLIKKRKIEGRMPGYVFAHNEPIDLGEGFIVSVQASEYHYCDPTETFEDMMQYEAFEVGLFRQVGNDTHGIALINDNIQLMDYGVTHDFIFQEALNGSDIKGCFEVPDQSVMVTTFVAPKIVQAIVDDIRQIVRKIRSRTVLVEKYVSKTMISY